MRVRCTPLIGRLRLDQTHCTVFYRGVFMCLRCGHLVVQHMRCIAKPCSFEMAHRKSQVAAFLTGRLPNSLRAWPHKAWLSSTDAVVSLDSRVFFSCWALPLPPRGGVGDELPSHDFFIFI